MKFKRGNGFLTVIPGYHPARSGGGAYLGDDLHGFRRKKHPGTCRDNRYIMGYFSLDISTTGLHRVNPDNTVTQNENIYSVPIISAPDESHNHSEHADSGIPLILAAAVEQDPERDARLSIHKPRPGSARARYGFGVWMRMKAGARRSFTCWAKTEGGGILRGVLQE